MGWPGKPQDKRTAGAAPKAGKDSWGLSKKDGKKTEPSKMRMDNKAPVRKDVRKDARKDAKKPHEGDKKHQKAAAPKDAKQSAEKAGDKKAGDKNAGDTKADDKKADDGAAATKASAEV